MRTWARVNLDRTRPIFSSIDTMITNWQAAGALTEAAQRQLLGSKDPAERLWATWALALRLGRGSLPGALEMLHAEPASGVRAQLVVVLAGLGELDIVRGISVDDSDPMVRGTACQYVIRTLPIGSPDALSFAIERMRNDVPRVRRALLQEALAGRLHFPEAVLVDSLTGSDLESRRFALQLLRNEPELFPASLAYILRDVPTLEDVEVREGCLELVLRANLMSELLQCAVYASESFALAVLRAFEQIAAKFPWTDLQALGARPEPSVWLHLLDLQVTPLDPDAVRWLAERVAHVREFPSNPLAKARSTETRFYWEALRHLYRVVAPETVCLLGPKVAQALLQEFLWEMDRDEEWSPQPGDLEKETILKEYLRSTAAV